MAWDSGVTIVGLAGPSHSAKRSVLGLVLCILHNTRQWWARTTGTRRHSGRQPFTMVGTHHKTGTFIADKLFSAICGEAGLQCEIVLSGSTAVQDAALIAAGQRQDEIAIHHTWQGTPSHYAELAGRDDWRFVHVVREPCEKIVSGFLYHRLDWHWHWRRRFRYCLLFSTCLLRASTSIWIVPRGSAHGRLKKSPHSRTPHALPCRPAAVAVRLSSASVCACLYLDSLFLTYDL